MGNNIENIPQELRELKQWVVWKKNKRPYNPNTLVPAKTNDPSTWGTFEEARKAVLAGKAEGVGFVFTDDDPYFGIDLDNAIDDDGKVKPWAQAIIDKMDSYTEISQSGRGIHIIGRGRKPNGRCKK